jgi:hypothetical protein
MSPAGLCNYSSEFSPCPKQKRAFPKHLCNVIIVTPDCLSEISAGLSTKMAAQPLLLRDLSTVKRIK